MGEFNHRFKIPQDEAIVPSMLSTTSVPTIKEPSIEEEKIREETQTKEEDWIRAFADYFSEDEEGPKDISSFKEFNVMSESNDASQPEEQVTLYLTSARNRLRKFNNIF